MLKDKVDSKYKLLEKLAKKEVTKLNHPDKNKMVLNCQQSTCPFIKKVNHIIELVSYDFANKPYSVPGVNDVFPSQLEAYENSSSGAPKQVRLDLLAQAEVPIKFHQNSLPYGVHEITPESEEKVFSMLD
ncbi:MAG: hypothetical protein WCX73_01145 [Candidatus Pacearchaeota archaeon]|jgi:hypothetical protein